MPLRADANECKKKEKKKKNLLGMGACRRECIACGWSCVWMVLHADGLACGWCCVWMRCMGTWMVVAAEMVGADECKEKTKKKYLLKPGWTQACGCVVCRRGSFWMWLVVNTDECKEKRKKKNTYQIKCE